MLTTRFVAGACLAVGLLLAPCARADDVQAPDKVSFYFAAHEDDWQLFMNPSAFQDVAESKTMTVFVHMTAGDAGLGTGNGGRKHPYYLARENGAETAIQFMADSGNLPVDKTESEIEFNGHRIYRVSYRNTVAYYLRLPDGHPSGSGFQQTGYQSLKRLAEGNIDTLAAIDGSTAYRGWNDLVEMLRALVNYERGRSPAVQLNVAEQNSSINPHDHSDHQMTAKAALDATDGLACARRVYYVDYASSHLPENLDDQQSQMESSVLAVTAAGILAFDHTSIWARYHRTYLGRNYFRAEEPSGRCDGAVAEAAVHAMASHAASGSPKAR
jgi:hypothetical protein